MMGKVFGMIALACLLAFSFSAYAKEQNCEQESSSVWRQRQRVHYQLYAAMCPNWLRKAH